MKQSAGTLLYRRTDRGIEVLLIHASGAYNRRAPWGIPKGKPEPGEDMETTARRETLEETGVVSPTTLVPIGTITYVKSRKTIHAFAGELPPTVEAKPASWEVDKAEFLPLETAYEKIHPDQAAFLERLEALLRDDGHPVGE